MARREKLADRSGVRTATAWRELMIPAGSDGRMICWLILLTGAYPLWAAWRANRRTTLVQAVQWSMIAWAAWGAALAASVWPGPAEATARYVALSLTGCAGVAVLGARRPGVTAWNFVVVGLLAVLLWPLVEGGRDLSPLRLLFLGAVLAVGLLNYLPTRLAPAVVLLGIGCATEFAALAVEVETGARAQAVLVGRCLLAISPWVALARSYRSKRVRSEFDRLWLSFRDRFGLFWGQRLREQFNRSAAHAGWPVYLAWRGLRRLREDSGTAITLEDQKEMVATLRALLKRFGPDERKPPANGVVPSG